MHPHLPHHQPDRAAVPGARASRGWRARAASRRSSTARTPSRTSRSRCADLECDYYGCSLHKWMLAPVGTGFLYVRRENIAKVWPLTPAAASKADNIRKFEEIGTHPAANHNADRRSARLPPGDRHRAQGGAAALPERSLGQQGRQAAGREDPQQPRAEPGVGTVQREPRARRVAQGLRLPVVEVPHHHRGDQARRLPGPARHAERLHARSRKSTRSRWRSRICSRTARRRPPRDRGSAGLQACRTADLKVRTTSDYRLIASADTRRGRR